MAFDLQGSIGDEEAAVRFIRTRQVLEMIGVGRTTLWQMVRSGCFPRPVRVTQRMSRYQLEAVEEWMRLRAQGLTWPPGGKPGASAAPRGGEGLARARQPDAHAGAPR